MFIVHVCLTHISFLCLGQMKSFVRYIKKAIFEKMGWLFARPVLITFLHFFFKCIEGTLKNCPCDSALRRHLFLIEIGKICRHSDVIYDQSIHHRDLPIYHDIGRVRSFFLSNCAKIIHGNGYESLAVAVTCSRMKGGRLFSSPSPTGHGLKLAVRIFDLNACNFHSISELRLRNRTNVVIVLIASARNPSIRSNFLQMQGDIINQSILFYSVAISRALPNGHLISMPFVVVFIRLRGDRPGR